MQQRRGGWGRFGERTIYDSRWVRLGQLDVQAPSGERFGYHVVRLPRIAIALVLNRSDEVLMLWRYRVVTDQWDYELLGGLVEDGEEPAATGAREALEESEWAPIGQPQKLVEFEPLPGTCPPRWKCSCGGTARRSASPPIPTKPARWNGFPGPGPGARRPWRASRGRHPRRSPVRAWLAPRGPAVLSHVGVSPSRLRRTANHAMAPHRMTPLGATRQAALGRVGAYCSVGLAGIECPAGVCISTVANGWLPTEFLQARQASGWTRNRRAQHRVSEAPSLSCANYRRPKWSGRAAGPRQREVTTGIATGVHSSQCSSGQLLRVVSAGVVAEPN